MGFFKKFWAFVGPVETEQVRARDDNGRGVADDPDTPENEAFTTVKKSKKKTAEKK